MASKTIGPTCEPSLNYLLGDVQRQTALSINCVQIGTIEEYHAENNTAKVSINFKVKMKNGEDVSYPALDDCPVFVISGGDASLSMPITAGDTCLVLFNDKNIDDWYLTGKVSAPADNRIHSIADGIVLVGIRSLADLKVYPEMTTLDGGSKKIAIKNDDKDLKTLLASVNTTIKSTIDTIKEMNTKINALVDLIAAITVPVTAVGAPSGVPVNAATITATKTDFTSYNTTLDTRKSDLTNLSADMALLLDEGSLI
jgi:hypothetical protein